MSVLIKKERKKKRVELKKMYVYSFYAVGGFSALL